MPFQDKNDLQFQIPRQPSVIERWLRKLFVEDLNLKLTALAITLILWFAVTGQKKPTTKRFAGVRLSFVLADGIQISNDPPAQVDVTLTGSSDKLAQINQMDLAATVLVSDYKTGDRVVRLSRDRVKLDPPEAVQEGIQIEAFQPATVSLRLESQVKRELDVNVRLEGKVAEGYEVYSVSSNPAQVRISGPVSHVNPIEKAPTESISLDGRKASFDLAQVMMDIPDQKIDLMDAVVAVHVEIGELSVERSFSDVQVRSASGADVRPLVANVTLFGPPSVFAQLSPEDIKVVVETSTRGPRLELPPGIQDKVKLRSIKPASFSVPR